MPHPLSEIITAKINGSDPHARTTITNAEAVEIRAELDRLNDNQYLRVDDWILWEPGFEEDNPKRARPVQVVKIVGGCFTDSAGPDDIWVIRGGGYTVVPAPKGASS